MDIDLKASILIVDDAPDNLMLMNELLQERYEVKLANNGLNALKAVQQLPVPDLILLDVMMPDMDGPGVLAGLRVLPAGVNLPVVFLTAKTATAELERLRALGAVGVLTKPFDPMTLHQQVKDVWERVLPA